MRSRRRRELFSSLYARCYFHKSQKLVEIYGKSRSLASVSGGGERDALPSPPLPATTSVSKEWEERRRGNVGNFSPPPPPAGSAAAANIRRAFCKHLFCSFGCSICSGEKEEEEEEDEKFDSLGRSGREGGNGREEGGCAHSTVSQEADSPKMPGKSA